MTPIERIRTPDTEELLTRFIRRHQPVILTDLFDEHPIREVATLDEARRSLGDVRLGIRENYDATLFEGDQGDAAPSPPEMSLAEYLDFVAVHDETTRMCMEQLVPDEVARLAPWPRLVAPYQADGLALLFAGNRGNYARFHFDSDARHVLFYQAVGEKRLYIAPPSAGPKLVPLANFSMICTDQLSAAERADLVRYLGGVECTLGAGETLYIPALHWHFVDYLTTGISLAFRLGRSAHSRTLAAIHPSYRSQGVRARFLGDTIGLAEQRELEALSAALAERYTSPTEMYRAMETAVEVAYRRLCPESFQGTYCVTGLEECEEALGVAFYRREAADKFAGSGAGSSGSSHDGKGSETGE